MNGRRASLVLVVFCVAGCLSASPVSDAPTTGELAYQPFEVTVEGPASTADNDTLVVRATLRSDHPDVVAPMAPVVAVENVTVTVSNASLAAGDGSVRVGRVEPGETVSASFAVCAPTPPNATVTVTVDGTVVTANSTGAVGPEWVDSTAIYRLSGESSTSAAGGGETGTDRTGRSCAD
jgi:hypothetical protein